VSDVIPIYRIAVGLLAVAASQIEIFLLHASGINVCRPFAVMHGLPVRDRDAKP
jgi:hypothetical protein